MALFKVKAVPDFTQLRNELTKLSSTPVKIKVDATEFQALSNQAIKTMNATARLTKAQNELAVAQEKTKQTANQLAAAQQKTTQTANQLATQMERTATAEEKARKANLDLSREIQRATTEQEKQKTAAAQAALQQEKTATSAANLAVQQEKTATAAAKAAGNITKVGQSAKETSGFAGMMGDSFANVVGKMVAWQLLGSAISGAVNAFRDALDTMKSVDDEMVTIRKVTGATTEELQKIEAQAYKTASAYGVAADEYLNSVAAFTRAGYGDQSSALAELATKTQIVGDTDAKTAQQFLLSVDAAYKYQGSIESLSKVLDGANEIDNKYATSIEKIAEGLGKVAPIASQAHVGVDELTAAIGTITAVTQRSGTEAATALRALFLNIIGDTKTEIDEGVTWTTGEIAGLRDVIKLYAKDAYEAAEATGSVINPMEAIGGLAQSMKDGLLTEQQLMEMVSDIGGKLRTSQLLALIQNWDMYKSMLGDYANSIGSADKEVENALDSWSRKTEILRNKWTEFISHLVETDGIKGALDGLIGMVELLDSDVGHFIITVGALTTAVILLGQAKKALAGTEVVSWITQAIPKIKELITAVTAYAAAKKAAALGNRAAESALTFLKPEVDVAAKSLGSLASKFGIAAGFAVAFYAAIKAGTAKFDAYNEAVENTAEAQSKLSDYKTELADLESRTGTLTDAERRRLEVLREITAEQEKQVKAAKQTEYETYSEAYGSGAGVATGTTGTGSGGIGGWGSVETIQRDVYQLTEYQRQLNDLQEQYANQTKDSAMSTGEYYTALQTLNDGYAETVEKLRDFILAGIEVTDNERELVMAYDEAQVALGNVGQSVQIVTDAYNQLVSSGEISKSTWETLIAYYPQLADAATQTADGYEIQRGALENLMSAEQRQQAEIQNTVNKLIEEARQSGATGKALYDLVAAQIAASNTGLNFTQQMAALQELALQAGYTMDAINAVFAASGNVAKWQLDRWDEQTIKGLMQLEGMSRADAEAEVIRRKWGSLTTNYTPSTSTKSPSYSPSSTTPSNRGSMSSSASSNAAARKNAQAEIKRLQKERDAELDVIQKQIDALQEQAEIEDRQAKIEEYKLEILKKQDAVMNARNERTVRQYNASTGQWEWVADATKVKKAEEELENAKKELREYERKVELDLAVEELKTRQEAIKAAYQIKIDAWQDYLDGLANAVARENALLNQSVMNNKSAVDQILADKSRLNNTDDGGSGSDDDGNGGNSTGQTSPNQWIQDRMKDGDTLGEAQRSWAALYVHPGGTRPTSYDNMGINSLVIEGLQLWYDATRDGKWGGKSYDAAGGRDAQRAYELYANFRSKYDTYKKFTSATGYYDEGGILKGMGGIKATTQDEIVLPPKLAARMLTPLADRTFKARLGELGFLYGSENSLPRTLTGSSDNRSYTDNSGTRYQIGSITMTEGQAKCTTIYEAAQLAHNLQAFSG